MSSKTERLINLIAILSDTMRPLTQGEIVNTVPGYSTNKVNARRTFERDKDHLRKLGFDILQVSTPEGEHGYNINKDNTFYSVPLSASQRNILQCAIAMYSTDENTTAMSLTKLGGANPENEIDSVISIPMPENVDLLFKYCSNSSCISFSYRDTTRKVKTKKLVAKGGFWYLECIDLDKFELRNFRIDRLNNIEEIKNVEIDNEEIILAENTNEEQQLIKVKVHSDLEKTFTKDWNANIETDGTISFKVPRLELFFLRYFDYLGYVRVIEPKVLVDQIDDVFNRVSKQLGGS